MLKKSIFAKMSFSILAISLLFSLLVPTTSFADGGGSSWGIVAEEVLGLQLKV